MTVSSSSSSRPEEVFRQLVLDIMLRRYAPGESLPSERTFSERLGVSRSVVREALKRLDQLGLIRTLHGGSTRVEDFRKTAGLDLLGALASWAPHVPDATHWLVALLEMRAALGADCARLCALRGHSELKQRLLATAQQMRAEESQERLFQLEVSFWEDVLEGADNIAYRLASNTMMRVIQVFAAVSQPFSALEVKESEFRLPLAEAIAAHDPERAEGQARNSLRKTAERVAFALGRSPVPASGR